MSLFDKIYNLKFFQDQLKALIKESVQSVFSESLISEENGLFEERVDWNRLLPCASALAHSDKADHQDAALRIAQNCVTSPATSDIQKKAGSIILHKLTNIQAIDLAIDKKHIPQEIFNNLPLPFRLEHIRRDTENLIILNGESVYLNKFQKKFYQAAEYAKLVSASAPTSAGKSFILNLFVANHLRGDVNVNVVYLVPTRALINQVEIDFKKLFENNIQKINILSVPQLPEGQDAVKSNLLIFTQERLHWFLNENPNFHVDFLVVDEAQKISDGSRGVLLQQKIEELSVSFSNLKILFCSASTENPGDLLEGLQGGADDKSVKSLTDDYVAVNQNLIWVSKTRGIPKRWTVKFCYKHEDIPIGTIMLVKSPSNEIGKITAIASMMGSKDGGNMIYVNTQHEAEGVAKALAESYDQVSDINDSEIEELIEMSKALVHPQYCLAEVLKKGIAFHYGHMPLLLRIGIEELFKQGKVKYLICTSTLLEGVNLPAKNIFLRKPGRGSGQPLSDNDFWNLAGRAGRLKKEFQGNIICIDPEEWNPPRVRTRYKITRAVTEFSKDKDGIIQYIKDGQSANRSDRGLQSIFSYYFNKFLDVNSWDSINIDADFKSQLDEQFSIIKEKLDVSDEIIRRNPGISPIAMQSLFDYIKEYDNNPEKNIENLIPVLPENDTSPEQCYVRIIHIINQFLSGDHNDSGYNYYKSILIVSWIRGYPLPRIISTGFKRYQKDNPKTSLGSFIRKTMSDIEEEVRFKFAKFSSCYSDILKFYLDQHHPELAERVPELQMALEFGVSQKTSISLIKLGLSRHGAIEVSAFVEDKNFSVIECEEWLVNGGLEGRELSVPVRKEMNVLLEKLNKQNK